MSFHQELIKIPYRHMFEIRKTFKHVIGQHGISHFSILIFNPKDEMVFFSTTPDHGHEMRARGYADYDGIINPNYYKTLEFYWWQNAYHTKFKNKIIDLRENQFGLMHGFMLVRKWKDFHILYAFASKVKDQKFQEQVINNINKLLKIGDEAYNEILNTYYDYSGGFEPKKINIFNKFEGGNPIDWYYQLPENKSLLPDNQPFLNATTKDSGLILFSDYQNRTK